MKIRSILSLILAVVLLLCTVSCDNSNGDPVSTTTTTVNTPVDITICTGNTSSYQIVTSEDSGEETAEALKIFMAIESTFGASLKRVTDKTDKSDYEIVVGNTNRYAPSPALKEKEYIICVKDNSVLITAGSDRALTVAVDKFVNEYIKKDANGNLTLSSSLSLKETADIPDLKTVNLKIGSYNIKNGDMVMPDLALLAEDIIDNNIDIVGLQEVNQGSSKVNYQDTLEILAEETGYNYVYGCTLPSYYGGTFGNAILSKYPIVDYEAIELPKYNNEEELRVLLHAEIDIGGEIFHYFTTHLQQQAAHLQFPAINDAVEDYEFFAIGGDFNRQDFDGVYKEIKNTYLAHTGTVTTIHGYKFDNFIISNNISSKKFKAEETYNSDHYLIMTDISITFEVE